MRIGIDARLYGAKHAGIGRYTQKLIENLELLDKTNKYFIFLARDNFDEYQPKNPNFRKVSADFKVYGIFEQLLYPFQLYSYNLNIVHFPHFNAPLLYARKFVVTIHDLIITHFPSSRATTLHPALYKIKLAAYDFLVKAVSKNARKIIAVSEYTKSDIAKYLKIKSEKIVVAYDGVDSPLEAKECKDDIGGDFLLYVGSAYPHKNLEQLIDAFAKINQESPELKLVLVGRMNFFYERLKEYAEANCPPEALKKIIFAGYLPDEQLACLYRRAKLYVFPSLIEGFGLPPLEAQTYGLPVASSDKTCMPEVLGDSAIFFDPENARDMADKIRMALGNSALRSQLIEKGYLNAKKYSWRKMAEEILSIYNS